MFCVFVRITKSFFVYECVFVCFVLFGLIAFCTLFCCVCLSIIFVMFSVLIVKTQTQYVKRSLS